MIKSKPKKIILIMLLILIIISIIFILCLIFTKNKDTNKNHISKIDEEVIIDKLEIKILDIIINEDNSEVKLKIKNNGKSKINLTFIDNKNNELGEVLCLIDKNIIENNITIYSDIDLSKAVNVRYKIVD